jgi:hypothetical protein
MEDNGSIQDIIVKNCLIIYVQSSITSLLNACRTMQTLPRQEGWAKLRGVSGLYSKAMCFEFHQLLLATLISYGKALDGFVAALDLHKSKPNFLDLISQTDEVWICTSLLWSIAYSRILDNHLAILSANGWLGAPSNPSYPIYSSFTIFSSAKDQTLTLLTDEDEECGNKGEEIKALSAGVEPSDLAEEDKRSGHEEEEIDTNINPGGQADLYQWWIHLQVDRWQATQKITTILACSPTLVNLTLLAIRYIPPQPADSVMNLWRGTIRDLCQTANIDPKPVIDTLVDKIRKELQENSRHNTVFCKSDLKPKKVIQYVTRVHCASLLKYPSGGGCDSLRMHIYVRSLRGYRYGVC